MSPLNSKAGKPNSLFISVHMLTVIVITLVAEPTITTGKGLDITYLSSIIRLSYNRASEEAFSTRARHRTSSYIQRLSTIAERWS